MLPMLLLILKIAGILVLVLLGSVLLLLFLMLLVPLRYRVSGSYLNGPAGKARVTWLLHILSVTAEYGEDVSFVIRLFGFRLRKRGEKAVRDAEDFIVHATEAGEDTAGRTEAEPFRYQRDGLSAPDGADEPLKADRSATRTPAPEQPETNGSPKPEPLKTGKRRRKRFLSPWLSGLQKLPERIQIRIRRFLSVFVKLKFIFRNICGKLKRVKEQGDELCRWLKDGTNQRTIRLLLRLSKKLLCHLLPGKGRIEVVFGFEDPYVTGQALTALSVIYPFCHKRILVTPMFDRRIFTAKGALKGRVRMGTLLLIAGRALLDKNFRILLKKWL